MSEVFRIFENIQDVMFVIDEQSNVYFGNDAAIQLLDVSARRLSSGKPLENFFSLKQPLVEEGKSLTNIVEPTPSREVQYVTSSGKEGWGQISIQSLPEALRTASGMESAGWIIYLRDVTLEKNLNDKYKAQLDAKEVVIKDLEKARAELENYSKNLEKMVEERTAELREANRMIATILDSLGQGIFVFDRNGKSLPFYSKVSEKMFGISPAGKPVAEVLRLDVQEKSTFDKWVEAIFSEMLEFQDLAPLGPSRLTHSEDRHIAFDFHPMHGESRSLQGVVLVATDKTEEMKARREAEKERSFAKRVVQIVQHRQQFKTFATEAFRICGDLVERFSKGEGLDSEEITRHLHTVKGGAASFSLLEIAEDAHHCEDVLIKYLRTKAQTGDKSSPWPHDLRQQLKAGVESMLAHLKEFIENHSFLLGSSNSSGRTVEIPAATLADWHRRMQDPLGTSRLSHEIFENWVQEPAVKAFSHVSSGLIELASRLGKRIKPLAAEGGDVKVLPEAYSDLFGTFIHAFRNAVDHGIETPEERIALGKPEDGQLTLHFEKITVSGTKSLKIEICDDGRGIDPHKIRTRLEEKGLEFNASATDQEIIQAVFRDDFSTAQTVTDISGRGVGLSAIKSEAEKMGGSATISSVVGQGSKLTVIVPDIGENAEIQSGRFKQVG